MQEPYRQFSFTSIVGRPVACWGSLARLSEELALNDESNKNVLRLIIAIGYKTIYL